MRIGIDAHMVGGQETGNETYVKGLVEGLLDSTDLDLVVYHVGAPWLPRRDHLQFSRLRTARPYFRLGVELPARSRHALDVLHMTYVAPLWSAAPIVVTVHDICFATNPEWFSARDRLMLSALVPWSIRRAAHVITVSNAARSEIILRYGVDEGRISAIPNGPGGGAQAISDEDARRELVALAPEIHRPYILAVGNVQPRKNLGRLFRAFQELVEHRGHDMDLLVVGPKRFLGDDIVRSASSTAARVHFTGYVTDRQLAACYQESTVFVLPSLYEGFGLPVLEAMAHGVPVACSNAGGIPEVCGDAGVMFDPRSVEAIVEAVHRILTNASLRESLKAAALSRAGQFSWRRSAEATLDIYRKVAA